MPLKSLFISCKFKIPGVIAFDAFLQQLKKNHCTVDSYSPSLQLTSEVYCYHAVH